MAEDASRKSSTTREVNEKDNTVITTDGRFNIYLFLERYWLIFGFVALALILAFIFGNRMESAEARECFECKINLQHCKNDFDRMQKENSECLKREGELLKDKENATKAYGDLNVVCAKAEVKLDMVNITRELEKMHTALAQRTDDGKNEENIDKMVKAITDMQKEIQGIAEKQKEEFKKIKDEKLKEM